MRISIDLPHQLLKHLELLNIERSQSFKDVLISLLEKGLASERAGNRDNHAPPKHAPRSPVIKTRLKKPLPASLFTNAALYDALDATSDASAKEQRNRDSLP